MYELYFVRRLVAELELANRSQDPLERLIHLQACRYYRDLIDLNHKGIDGEPTDEPVKP